MTQKRTAIYNFVWMLGQALAGRASGLISQLVLAAILSPSDFGIIGLAYTITNIVSSVLNVAVDDIILQRKQSLHLWLGPALWISLSLSSLTAIVVLAFSPFAASFFDSREILVILIVLSVSMPINGLATVPNIILRSKTNYKFIALVGTSEVMSLAVMTISFAYIGAGAYSFVFPVPIIAAFKSAILWYKVRDSFDLRPHRKRWKYLFGKTTALFSTKALISFISQGDYLILGVFASKEVVGGYYFAYRLAAQPLLMLASNISSVLLPELINLKSDETRQNSYAFHASLLLSYSIMPVAFIQAAAAEPLISALFQKKWLMSVPIIQILSIGLAFDAISWIAGSLLSSKGKFSLLLIYISFQVPVFFIFVSVGAYFYSALGVAWAVFAFYVLTQPIFIWRVYASSNLGFSEVAAVYLKPAMIAGVSSGIGILISRSSELINRPLIQIIFILVTSSVVYLCLLRFVSPKVWNELSAQIFSRLRR